MRAFGRRRGNPVDHAAAVDLFPPAKVRFTVIDPVGLGEEFSAFMHLADYDELLIAQRIWTEPSQIEKRLADLSEHMENVFQKYLRNEFETIEEYNEQAGEVAEPYQFLVVANFPANFTETAPSGSSSIATSGPACGVYTLISVDTRQPLPHGFDLADLEAVATTLDWKGASLLSRDPDLGNFPAQIESPPQADRFYRNRPLSRLAVEGRAPRRGRLRSHCSARRRIWTPRQPPGYRRSAWAGPVRPSCNTSTWVAALRSTC